MRFAGFVLAAFLAMPAAAQQLPTADERFAAIYTAEAAWSRAQFTGETSDTEAAVPAHLPDVGPDAQAQRLAYWQDVRRQLDTVDITALTHENQVNYRVYAYSIDSLIASQQFRDFERPINSDSTFWGDLLFTARTPLHDEADYRRYLSWLGDMPGYFDQQIENMRAGLNRHFTPPKVTLMGREASIEAIVKASSPEESVFYLPFQKMPATIPADAQASLRAEAAAAIRDRVIPAHRKLLAFFTTDYAPHAQESLGADALPDGKAWYQSKIREFTTLDMTAAQIHQTGLDEMARIHAQMLDVLKQTGFSGDFPAFLHFLRTDPQFYAKTPQQLLDRAAWTAKRFDGVAAQWFGHLPRSRFGIVAVPDEMAPYYTAGRGGEGSYLVNTYDLPSRPLYQLTALTLHESAPGHAFQLGLASENKAVPEFRRNLYISAYGEGWALYCEKLGIEMGMYDTPYERFGYLSYQAWRAARLVVDTGIHTMGWTREQALQYMRGNTALSEHEINTEVDRYISWPGQALSYYLGEMAIVDARTRAEKALGPKFNIRAFHDTVLALGSVPLPVLQARIDQFITEGGVGPYPDEEK